MSVRFPQSLSGKEDSQGGPGQGTIEAAVRSFQELVTNHEGDQLNKLYLLDKFNDSFKKFAAPDSDSDDDDEPPIEDDEDALAGIVPDDPLPTNPVAAMYVQFSRVCMRIEQSDTFQGLITTVLLIAGLAVGLETYPSVKDSIGTELHILENVILGVFVIEARAHAQRPLRLPNHGLCRCAR